MHPDIEIRRANSDDYDAVCELFRLLDAHHVEILPDNFCPFPGPVRPRERFLDKVSAPDNALFLAVSEGKLIGFVDVQRDSNPPFPMFKAKQFALLDNLFVLDERRRSGVGRALFGRAKAWAREHGLSSMRLNVYSANSAAIRFYQEEGLVPFKTTFEVDL